MLYYYFKFAIRNIRKNKIFTCINIFGLAIGIICCILAFLYIQNELKYDKHFTNTKNVYLLYGNNFNGHDFATGQPARILPAIINKFPEIENGLIIHPDQPNLKINGKHFYPENLFFADSNFFTFLGWNLVSGNPETVLNVPFNVTISESKAKELFGDTNPIGQNVLIELRHQGIITGVFKDIPEQSHINADFIVSLSSYHQLNSRLYDSWGWFGNYIYVKVNEKSDIKQVKEKLALFWNELNPSNGGTTGPHIKLRLKKFSDIYLRSNDMTHDSQFGNINQLIGFAIIALFILIIACFNFINLSTALLSNRFVEAGIKKMIGARSKHLNRQIITESFVFVLFAIILSIISIKIILPFINTWFNKNLEFSLLNNTYLVLFFIVIFLVTLIGTGLYPSIYFSKTKPVRIIKQHLKGNGRTLGFWNTLIISQFIIGIFLIITSLMVNKQMAYIRSQNLGFNKDNILVIDNDWDEESINRYNLLKESLQKYPEISMISSGINVPANNIWNWGFPQIKSDLSKAIPSCGYVSIDYDYMKLLGAKIIMGRDFNNENPSDNEKVIISSTSLKKLEMENPIGKTLTNLWDGIDREIIGVVEDIQYNTIHNKQKPAIFLCHHRSINHAVHILVKFNSNNVLQTVKKIQNLWEEQNPTRPFGSFFLDTSFQEKYESEVQTATIMKILTGIAILLCCMGLFGLSIFITSKRIKEIGIRKVNGAKNSEVIALLNKDFVLWVTAAFLIATPLTWYTIFKWLENFAYKTSISWWIFALSGIIAFCIAVVTASWQSWMAARRNPVESLRYE